MSVRAYRVNEIKTENNPSFNLWHDEKLMDYLESSTGFYNQLNQDANGIGGLELEELEEAVKLDLEPETMEALKADIAWLKKNGDTYIEYYCY